MTDTMTLICEIGVGETPTFQKSVRVDIRKMPSVTLIADARHLPFKNESFDHVYSSHTIEHFSHGEIADVLKEWVRICIPGGKIELRCPDLRARALLFFLQPTIQNIKNIYGGQEYPENIHRSGFSFGILKNFLTECGVQDIRRIIDGFKGIPFLPNDLHVIGRKKINVIFSLQRRKAQMKILQVVSTPPFAWATGGCARVVYDLSRELVKDGQDVSILTTDLHTPEYRYYSESCMESVEGIKIFRYRNISNFLAWKIKLYFAPGLLLYLIRHIKEFDIVHLQDLISIHAIMTSYYCRKTKIPYILTLHGSIPWLDESKFINRIFKKTFANNILYGASEIVVLNKTEFDQCRNKGLPENHIHIIPNGITIEDYSPLPSKGDFKKQLAINPEEKIILYLGRLHKSKGIEILVDAFYKLSIEVPRIKLVFIGPDDGYRKNLEDQIKTLQIQNITLFRNYVNENEKLSAFMGSEVIVIPKFSGFPVTFLESCICGLPIITTNESDNLDWIDKQVGYVVDSNADAIKNALKLILNDEKIRTVFSKNCVNIVHAQFGWNILVKKIESLYQDSLSQMSYGN